MTTFDTIKTDLLQKVLSLKLSVDIAVEQFSTANEFDSARNRLESYYPGIEKCLSLINEIDKLISDHRYSDAEILTTKVKAISELIKEDAQDFILTMQTGFSDHPDMNSWN
ncbi:hypothetical protein UFOVP410_75 [uncultured Caudovirales phage]|uniref:Uncharacterized protein n=1 Tax=uncultured Caudovirales phage TaxID=2100421 RepID=A0A6J5M815_9CAUD|nr:hypothetical protein UFOVP410_75 [uncultured Caudovirales phage]